MGNLFRADSATSPQVNFSADLRRYSISGKSLPENAAEFFDPILIWLKNFEETILRKTREGMLINEQHTFVFDFQCASDGIDAIAKVRSVRPGAVETMEQEEFILSWSGRPGQSLS